MKFYQKCLENVTRSYLPWLYLRIPPEFWLYQCWVGTDIADFSKTLQAILMHSQGRELLDETQCAHPTVPSENSPEDSGMVSPCRNFASYPKGCIYLC